MISFLLIYTDVIQAKHLGLLGHKLKIRIITSFIDVVLRSIVFHVIILHMQEDKLVHYTSEKIQLAK